VNSAFYGLRHKMDSIASAIMYLGTRTLRNVVVMDCLNGYFLSEAESGENDSLSRTKLFTHGAAVGTCAQLLSRRLFSSPGEDAFLAGIVHDIGLLIEAQVREADLRRAFDRYVSGDAPLVECEREFLGTDHCEVGRALAQKWLFPAEVADVVGDHHTRIDDPAAVASLCGVIQAADYVASLCGGAEAEGRIQEPEGAVAAYIQAHGDDFRVLIEDARREIARAGCLGST
jgi:HD-like signal output (HDOD) protein